MARRSISQGQRLALSLLLTLIAATIAAYFVVPAAMRWHMLNKLTSPDLPVRERGLNYVIHKGKKDDRVITGAVDRMREADDANFMQILNAIHHAGKWERPPVADDAWLRWLELLAAEEEADARIVAATRLADVTHADDEPRVHRLLGKLIGDQNEDVRYNALIAAAALAPQARDRKPLEAIVLRGASDGVPVIARQAWLFVGLLTLKTPEPAWREAPPAVAEAMIWADTKTRAKSPDVAVAALNDREASLAARAMAAYALHMSPSSDAQGALTGLLFRTPPEAVTPQNQIVLWRAMLAVRREGGDQPDLPGEAIQTWAQKAMRLAQPRSPLLRPLLLAATHRTGKLYPLPPDTQPSTQPEFEGDITPAQLDHYFALLAAYESDRVAEAPAPDPRMPDALRLTMLAKTAPAALDAWQRVLAADDAALRDLACVTAAQKLSPDELDTLIAALLRDFDDHAKISGAVLAGLSSRQGALLEERMNKEDRWPVKTMMKLGLWMQGRGPDMAELVGGLFARSDIPTTTLLLVLLHKGDRVALDYLFNPRGEPRLNLIELFDQRRWWLVLQPYLPAEAPPFWVWGDPALEHFQVEVLRNWYLINRDTAKLRASSSSQARP